MAGKVERVMEELAEVVEAYRKGDARPDMLVLIQVTGENVQVMSGGFDGLKDLHEVLAISTGLVQAKYERDKSATAAIGRA
jgi:hypothetical protein